MKHIITPERLLGEYIGTLTGICAWDIPEQLREKLERRAKELQELQIEMEVQHRFKDTANVEGEPLYPHTLKEPLFDAPKMQTFSVPFDKTQPIVFTGNQDIYDITTMD